MSSPSTGNSSIVCNLKVHYRFYNSLLYIPILTHTIPIHLSILFDIRHNFVHPSSKCSRSFMFHHQYPVSISFVRTSAICLPHFMFINFIYRNICQIFECTECRLLYFEKKKAYVKMSRGKNGKNIR
jgi:hypothetical protein